MAITALPSTTVRLLNSAQVLTTPVSLVKELLDNSLDARATSIDIVISPNTLDKIEVRDNGHGIQPEDLDALARHGHTSKLRSFEELKFLGGLTLGFRGEALASAVELGEVRVTTKTEGESVGTMVKLKAAGGIDHQTRTSHPVGTTVSVKNFMNKLPVRKKTFEKEAAKTVSAITRLLQAYALARPTIRLSLKISNGGKGSWSFIPHPSGDIRDAVLRAIGREVALQCVDVMLPAQHERPSTETSLTSHMIPETEIKNFIVEAFLPSAQADPTKVTGGQYISVDSRPVAHTKGTVKKIVTTFKKYIQNLAPDMGDKVKSPFIRLNIRCPAASYDANIEPAKDEVLFGNEDRLLESVESLFKSIYGECMTSTAASDLLLADAGRQHYERESISEMGSEGDHSHLGHPRSPKDNELSADKSGAMDATQSNKSSKWGFDMSEDLAIVVEGNDRSQNVYRNSHSVQPYSKQTQTGQRNQHNPWTIAKRTSASETELISAPNNQNYFQTSPASSIVAALGLIQPHDPLPTSNQRRSASTPIQSPFSNRQQSYFNAEHDPSAADNGQPLQLLPKSDFISARSIVPDPLISPPPTQLSKPSNARVLRPFRTALLDTPARNELNGLRQTRMVPVHQISPASIDDTQGMSGNSDLIWAMDFEKRKEDATRRRREEVRASRAMNNNQSTSSFPRSSPHKNRYISATADLADGRSSLHISDKEHDEAPFQTSLSDDDPRAYFMKRQRSMALDGGIIGGPPKLVRTKSAKLPLEMISPEDHLQNLIQLLPIEPNSVRQAATTLETYDLPTGEFTGLDLEPTDISPIIQRLQTVASTKIKEIDWERTETHDIFIKLILRSME